MIMMMISHYASISVHWQQSVRIKLSCTFNWCTVTRLRRNGLSVRGISLRRHSTLTLTTVYTTCHWLFIITRRTAAMELSNKENSVTAAMHWPRSDIITVVWCILNKKHLKNVGPIRYCKPPLHWQSPGVASRTPAIAIAQAACDVHDNNNNNDDDDDNAWQRGPLWPHGMGPMKTRNAWQSLACNPPGIAVSPRCEQ